MQPCDADGYFGKVLREAKPSTRTGRAAALTVYFQFLELRHKIELHNLTGRVGRAGAAAVHEGRRPQAAGLPGLGRTRPRRAHGLRRRLPCRRATAPGDQQRLPVVENWNGANDKIFYGREGRSVVGWPGGCIRWRVVHGIGRCSPGGVHDRLVSRF